MKLVGLKIRSYTQNLPGAKPLLPIVPAASSMAVSLYRIYLDQFHFHPDFPNLDQFIIGLAWPGLF